MQTEKKRSRPKDAQRGSTQVRLFWMAVATVGLLLAGLAVASSEYIDRSERTVVGRSESVTLSSSTGAFAIETTARLDTGADRSSIDQSIVDKLGVDLTDAPTIKTSSALGTEERKLFQISVGIAGATRDLEMSVTDRSDRSFPVLLGVDALEGFVVDPARDENVTEVSNEAIGVSIVDATDRLVKGDLPVALLILLPLAAGIVVALRMVLGLQPLGTFAPVLLALAVIRAGGTFALLVGAALAATFAFQPVIVRLRVPRQARLAILIGVVVLMWLAVLGPTSENLARAHGVPVIVTVVVLDGLWVVLTDDGAKAAVRTTLHTAIAAFLVLLVIASPSVRVLALDHPFLLALAGVALAALAGSYRGLRLTEFVRFRRRPALHKPASEEPLADVGEQSASSFRSAQTPVGPVRAAHWDCATGHLDFEVVDPDRVNEVPAGTTPRSTELVGQSGAG